MASFNFRTSSQPCSHEFVRGVQRLAYKLSGCDEAVIGLCCSATAPASSRREEISAPGVASLYFSVKIWPCLWFSCSRCEADTLIWTSGTVCFCLDWSSWWEADSRRTLSVKYLIYITADRLLKHAPCLSPCQASKPTCSDVSLTEEPLWSKCFSSLLQDPSRSGCPDVNMELLWFFTLNLLSVCAHRYFPDRVRIRHNASTQLQYRELNPSCGVNKNKEEEENKQFNVHDLHTQARGILDTDW